MSYCDCEFAVRFDGKSDVPGYDPNVYRRIYNDANGSTPQERINALRKSQYRADVERSAKEDAIRIGKIGSAGVRINKSDAATRYVSYSIGAKSFTGEIIDFNNMMSYHLVEGGRVTNIQIFAGKGSNKVYRMAEKYAHIFGDEASEWSYVKGIAYIENELESGKAEIHWSECDEFGVVDMFVKRWL